MGLRSRKRGAVHGTCCDHLLPGEERSVPAGGYLDCLPVRACKKDGIVGFRGVVGTRRFLRIPHDNRYYPFDFRRNFFRLLPQIFPSRSRRSAAPRCLTEVMQPSGIPPDPGVDLEPPAGIYRKGVALLAQQREQCVDGFVERHRELARGRSLSLRPGKPPRRGCRWGHFGGCVDTMPQPDRDPRRSLAFGRSTQVRSPSFLLQCRRLSHRRAVDIGGGFFVTCRNLYPNCGFSRIQQPKNVNIAVA